MEEDSKKKKQGDKRWEDVYKMVKQTLLRDEWP